MIKQERYLEEAQKSPIDVLYAMVKFVKENETFFPDEDREFIEALKSIT